MRENPSFINDRNPVVLVITKLMSQLILFVWLEHEHFSWTHSWVFVLTVLKWIPFNIILLSFSMFPTRKVYSRHPWSLEMSTSISTCNIMKKTGREIERQRL